MTRSLLVATAFAGLIAAAPAHADKTLFLGGIGDLSGQGAVWGQALQGALRMVQQEVNDAGGIKIGNETYKISTTTYDDAYQSQKAVAAANRLIDQDEAKFVLGPLAASGAIAAKPIFEQNQVIDLVVGAYSRKVMEGNPKYIFRVSNTPVEFIKPILTWLKANNGDKIKRVVVMNPNDEAGWDMQELDTKSYAEHGFDLVAKELYERSTKDFQPILTRLIAQNPDMIDMAGSSPASAGLIVRQAREMGYKGKFIKIGGPGPREILTAAGKEAAEGVMQYIPADPSTEGYKKLSERFAKLYGHDMDPSALTNYDALKILLAAMQKAGSIETDKVAAAIPQVMPFKSIAGGDIVLGGKSDYGSDHQFINPIFVGTTTDGGLKIVQMQ